MAFMNQVKKAKIADALKKVMPKDWKWTLGVENHSTIRMVIRSAPFNILASLKGGEPRDAYVQVNEFHLDKHWDEPVLSVLKKAAECLNIDNFDKSDPMTDYFHVGHYVNLHIGAWNKPFEVVAGKKAKALKPEAVEPEAVEPEAVKAEDDKPETVKPIEFPTFTDADVVIVPVSMEKAEPTYADQMEHFISNL